MTPVWEVIWLPRERPNSSTSSDDGAAKSASEASVGRAGSSRDMWLSELVLLTAPYPALPAAMADDTSMGGHLATARATQIVDIAR